MEKNIANLTISSPEFVEGAIIPTKFSCKGEGINPTLVIDEIPEGTKSMALIAEDPDAPNGTFTHWVLFDIQPANSISENTGQGVSGVNTKGKMGYMPPCPPSGVHRYYFHFFALDAGLDLRPGSDRTTVEKAMEAHILAKGTLMGRFGAAEHLDSAEKKQMGGAATEPYRKDRTTVDETGVAAWTTDKKLDH